jgi:hypothetical protein
LQLVQTVPKLKVMPKTILTLAITLLLHNMLLGQTIRNDKAMDLTVGISAKKTIKAGDTITIRVKNLSSANRGFTIEAISLGKEPEYETAFYSAFFNSDSSFFQKLKTTRTLSKSENIGYTLPDYELFPYQIKGNAERLLTFVVRGKPLKKGVRLKLRITTDIIEEKSETVYSAPLTVLASPN